jgi:hypothetical protein
MRLPTSLVLVTKYLRLLLGVALVALTNACIRIPFVELTNHSQTRVIAKSEEGSLGCTIAPNEQCRFLYPQVLTLTMDGRDRSYQLPRWPDGQARKPYVTRDGAFNRLIRLEVAEGGELVVLVANGDGTVTRPPSQPEGFPVTPSP